MIFIKYTKDEFIEKLKDKYPKEEIKIIEFNGTSKKGIIYCNLCKKEYSIYRMGVLLKDSRKNFCPKCFLSQYTNQCIELCNKQKLIFKKINYNQRLHKPTIVYECNLCETENEKPFSEFLKYPTCIYCGTNSKRMSTRGFKNKLVELNLPYELIGEYKKTENKNLFKHTKCGFIFRARPHDILSEHTGCPKCSKKTSKGEQKIIDFLEKYKIPYVREKVFDWSDKKRYDFYLPEYNILIEYQGIQHFKTVNNYWIPLEEQQKIDLFKKNVAQEHGYNFFTINYNEYNQISSLLVQRLSNFGVIITNNEIEDVL